MNKVSESDNLLSNDSSQVLVDLPPKERNDWLHFGRNEIFLLLCILFYGIAFAFYEPYAPFWLSQFFHEDSLLIIGFVVVIPSLLGTTGTLFWGPMADFVGSKKFILVGLTSFTLMFVSLIFTFSKVYFLIMILLGYLLGSAFTANIFVFASRSIDKPKKVIFAKITITISIAFASLSPLVGWINDTFPTQSMTIQLIVATASCAVAIVFAFFIKERKPERVTKEPEIDSSILQKPKRKFPITSVPILLVIVLFLTFFFQAGAGFWAYSGIYFLETLSVPAKYFSIFLIVKTALAVPLSFLLGLVKKRKDMRLILTIFTGYFVAVNVIMTIFPTNWILLIIVYSVPMYPLYNVFLYAFVASYSNKERHGTAFSIFNAIGTLGYIIGIIILGAIADAWISGTYKGVLSMFPMSIIFSAVAFLIALFFYLFRLPRRTKQNVI